MVVNHAGIVFGLFVLSQRKPQMLPNGSAAERSIAVQVWSEPENSHGTES